MGVGGVAVAVALVVEVEVGWYGVEWSGVVALVSLVEACCCRGCCCVAGAGVGAAATAAGAAAGGCGRVVMTWRHGDQDDRRQLEQARG